MMNYEPLSKVFYKDKERYLPLYNARYQSDATYRFDFQIGKFPAFCMMTPELSDLLVSIYKQNAQIETVLQKLPGHVQLRFISTCMIDEMQLSNDIEGVRSSRQDFERLMDSVPTKKRKRFQGLFNKYMLLLEKDHLVLETCQDVRALYDELCLSEVLEEDENNRPDGECFRKSGVSVLSETQKEIHKGSFPESEIIRQMEQALFILNDESVSAMVRVAVFHYLFGYIHPFYDGNGRMSRFISSSRMANELNILTCFRLSHTIKKNLTAYYKSFEMGNNSRNRGDLTPFVLTFLKIVADSQKDMISILKDNHKKLVFYDELLREVAKTDEKGKEILTNLLASSLFLKEGFSVAGLCEGSGLSDSTVRKYLKEFQQQNLLFVDRKGRQKVYGIDIDFLDQLVDESLENDEEITL